MFPSKKPLIETKSGQVEGEYAQGLYIFKGLPYAAPPTGNLRWLPPQPVKPWQGVRRAQASGPVAPQNPGRFTLFREFTTPEPQSEDCLFLNIWTPGLDDLGRPVLVWLHGGAFTMGSGSRPQVAGRILSRRGDAVIVTLNYRLGLLGFLNLKEVTGGKIPSTGNEALLDQIAALAWVRDNISSFGGNPDNVTVFGESAGAMSIGCLLAMPSARGRFHKAILQSGAANKAKPLDKAVLHARQFLDRLGLKGQDISALRSLPVGQILFTQQQLESKMSAMSLAAPVIDGEILPELPLNSIQSGSASQIPLLMGTNLDEWRLFSLSSPALQKMDEARLLSLCQRLVSPGPIESLIEAYRRARTSRGASTSPLDLFLAIKTDYEFRLPAILLAEAQFRHHQSAFSYLFNWPSPALGGALGACHALEVGFVFGSCAAEFCGSGPLVERLTGIMQDAWGAFAHLGNPGSASLGLWPNYGSSRETMLLGENCYLEKAPFEAERRAWEAFPAAFTGRPND